ncbi:MAG: hypothetical protein RIS64_2766 [Bacteroidota bacterium]
MFDNMIRFWVFLICLLGTQHRIWAQFRAQDSLALVSLYNAAGGANWTYAWDLTQSIDNWRGVTLNAEGRVQKLVLPERQLAGSLPSSIINLSKLEVLQLHLNALTGSIPTNLDSLTNLTELYLHNNQFTDSIPTNLGNLVNLQYLALSANRLTGSIPTSLGNLRRLRHLLLAGNRLSGAIPTSLGNLDSLENLFVFQNELTGSIPTTFTNLRRLKKLYLYLNQLTGTIPTNLGNLDSLNEFYVYKNQLTGAIPISFQSATRLTDLDFQYNKIDSVPNLSTLTNLRVFHADSNRLTFDDIDGNASIRMTYTLQDSIFKDTTYSKRVGNALMIDLGIDGAMTTNTYKWYKNDTLIFTGNSNTFIINSLQLSDAGKYTAVVSNSDRPNVILYGRKAIVSVVDSTNTCRTQDSVSLVALYNATGGANWTNRWNLTQPMTSWYGITLNTDGCVRCIDLDGVADCAYDHGTGNNLIGTLPNLNMASLQTFNVAYNPRITGAIPTLTMPLLETLDIRSDSLTGSLPNFNLPTLKYLYFNNNLLTGSIPNFNLSNLSIIYGMKNQLSGAIPNFSATSLKFLYFDTNELTGSVPNFTLQTLEEINFSNNQLTGSVPNFAISSLKSIRLYNNRLTGTIPNFNLPNLKWIELQDNQLTGTIPNFAATSLVNLLLSNNQLSGSLPNFNYPNLEYLHLYTNQLTGSIPSFTLPALKELLLYENQLTGSIPNFAMSNLLSLKLYNNQLTGSIPNFNMPLLTHIVLNTNQLSGSIPNFSMPNLVLLDLYKNQLTGNFPSGLSTLLSTVRIDSNRFTFSHLIPNLTGLPTAVAKTYAPQDSIFSDTTYSKRVGDSLTIDVAIDNTLTTNRYTWYKNGTFYDTTRVNKLIINGLQLTNAGIYTCAVSNPNAPNLTLYSKKATVTVSAAVSACRSQDSLALLDLYNATGGSSWSRRDNWLSTASINTWYGVLVNAQGCVDTLLLDNNRLSGTLPTSMGNMTSLKVIFLPNNQLTGAIPTQFGNLTALVMLYLHKNQLTGSLPTELGNLTNLREFGVSENTLQGSIPASLGNLTNLTRLYLSRNQLTGAIPTTLRTMIALNDLYLDNNQLSDTIPSGLSQLSGLKNLFLGNNNLSGTIPTTFGRLSALQYLLLDNNNLSGTVPDSLGNLSQLQALGLDSNQLVGKIPVSFQRLTNLQLLHFHGNRIDSVPSLANLPLRADTITSVSGVSVTNQRGLRVQQNQLTFDDIIPNYNFLRTATYVFAPQDSFFKDTTYRKRTGDTLIVDLKMDGALTNNNYNWYKNDTFLTSTTFNKLIINGLQSRHVGVYTCRVTNATVDGFTLYSRKITLIVDSIGCQPAQDTAWTTTLCAGRTYRLPSGRTITTIGNYSDTLRAVLNATCDSIRYAIRVVADSSCRCSDSTALVTLYNTTGGATWRNRTNWLSANPVPTWHGIRVNAQGCTDSIGLANNNLIGTLPNLIMPTLQQLRLDSNALTGAIPYFNLPLLEYLGLSYNQLSDTIPDLQLGNLVQWDVQNNRLTGIVRNFNMRGLSILHFQSNRIDSVSDLYTLVIARRGEAVRSEADLRSLNKVKSESNRITFDDILPNMFLADFTYAPQDSIFRDTTISKNVGDTLFINLGIDGALTTNIYKWYKNDTLFRTDSMNRLIINGLRTSDAGQYTCKITNRNAPNLTLYSRKVTVMVVPAAPVVIPCRTRDSLALVALYNQNAVTALNQSNLNWFTQPNRPLEDWTNDGIPLTLSAAGCVTVLDLSNIGLNGRLADSIGNMTELEELYLQNNNFNNRLPNGLNRLTRLKILLLSNNLLTGLPDSIRKLVNLQELDLDDNEITGNIPSELGNLTRMRLLRLSKNNFDGKIPSILGNLNSLQELTLSDNHLIDSIPSNLGGLRNLKKLLLDKNRLTGKIPIAFQQLRVLTELNFASNQLDSCPSLAALTNLISCNATGNQLTFNDILPNLGQRFNLNYAPQDSIFRDTTYQRNAGDALTIDLGIDGNVPNNVYKWYHNGILNTTIATNQLIINPLQGNDGGLYTCIVTNPNAPNLTLFTRKAIVNLNCATSSQQRDTAICQGNAFTLPTGRVVTAAGTYRDTLRSRLLCDSIIITRLSLRSKDTTRLSLNDCTIARTQTDTTMIPNRFGCDSIVIRTRTARRDSIERALQLTCRANEVGIRILTRSTNQFGCDSIEYQRVVLAPSYRRDTTIWRCNQPDKTVDSVLRTIHGCDSVVAFHFRLCRTDSTVIQHIVCNTRQDSMVRLRNFCGCDSTVIHKFKVMHLDTVLTTEVVCNIAYVGTTAVVVKHERPPFCDSLITITQRVFDRCGCLRDSTQLYTGLIPNDDDNQNDYFIIPLLEQYTPNELVITDKRGMLVYRTLNYRNNWGGTNQNGEPLPQGVYNFVFRTANTNCLRRGVIDIKYVP